MAISEMNREAIIELKMPLSTEQTAANSKCKGIPYFITCYQVTNKDNKYQRYM